MVRIVGTQHRTQFVLDPAEALRRGRALDRMLSSAGAPVPRGVVRAPIASSTSWTINANCRPRAV